MALAARKSPASGKRADTGVRRPVPAIRTCSENKDYLILAQNRAEGGLTAEDKGTVVITRNNPVRANRTR
jgi:hypothetical protein